jgi:dihydrofolate synthase/folylpolyglutamate synthase
VDIVEALAWLDAHIDHEATSAGIAAGRVEGLSLESMAELMATLGDPQDAVPVLHLTGTNGKGSVAAMVTALVQASGLVVGTYTSPHIERVNERICRDGRPIPDVDLAEALSGVAAVEELLSTRPTWFELLTAAAFRWFADAPVEVAVVEVGLLGRFDATNVATADVAVVTSLGGDHTDFAPGWQEQVAQEKAGIITAGRPAVLGRVPAALLGVFDAERPDPLIVLGRDVEVEAVRLAVGGRVVDMAGPEGRHHDVHLPLHGAHQVDNAAVAITAVEALFGRRLEDEVVAEAFAGLRVPGRMEVVSHHPLVVLDAAHNPDAIEAVGAGVEEDFAVPGSRIVVLGMLGGRDPRRAVRALATARPDLVLCTTVGGDRGLPADGLAAACEAAGLQAEVVADPRAAVARALAVAAEEDLVLVCGSFRLLAAAREQVSRSAG